MVILVCSECYDKTPQTGWLINNRNLFFIVLEVGNSRSVWQHGWILVNILLGVAEGWLLVSSYGGKNGITGSHDYFTFSFLGNLHTVYHSDFTNLHSHLKHHQEYIAVISKVDNTLKFVLSSFYIEENEFYRGKGIYTQLQISFMMTPCISPDSQSLAVTQNRCCFYFA